MIKVGIIGGSEPVAGELIRLLVNHPDVEIAWVNSEKHPGRVLTDVHHGLIGESSLRFTYDADLFQVDVLFCCKDVPDAREWFSSHELPDDLRVVDLSYTMDKAPGFVYGLPELNRKAMVRGARRVVVPDASAMALELSLLPMAKNLMLNKPVHSTIIAPCHCHGKEPALLRGEVQTALRELQSSFDADIAVERVYGDSERGLTAFLFFESSIDIKEIYRVYDEFYEDHNFTFIVSRPPELKEVVGTNKCLVNIEKQGAEIVIKAVMDSVLKGAAGTAVHDMNLLFGLHERVGLQLKASSL